MKLLILLTIFLLFCCFSTANALTINGGVSYTVELARLESFEDVPKLIDLSKYSDFLKDKNYAKNMEVLKQNKYNVKNRYIMAFSSGNYSIRYKSSTNISYYYDNLGNLLSIEFDIGIGYPSKRLGYNKDGNLDSVTLDVSNNEQYVFDASKKLIAHWIGNNCYNEQGELVMTRE